MKHWRRIVSAFLSVSIVASLAAGLIPKAFGAETRNGRGLYLTEIYQNDVNRSAVYGNGSDHMEFVEVTNTAQNPVELEKDYTLWYEYPSGSDNVMKALTITAPDGDLSVGPGETVVLWSQRTDLGGTEGVDYASEAQFREAMRVPEGVKVFRVSGQNGFAENNRGFAVKNRDGQVVSYFHYNTTTDEVTADGLSVHLRIPDFGSVMQVYAAKKLTSAGVAYTGQLNGQREITAPENRAPQGVYITEIRPNDSNRDAQFGSGANDLMEALELYNSSDRAIDLNSEYSLFYRTKENGGKAQTLYRLQDDGTLSSEDCAIPAGSPAVLWCYRAEALKGQYTTYPTEEQFRQTYGIPENVPVYVFVDQNGLGNTLRGFELYRKEADGALTRVSYYFWDGVTDLKDNRSVELCISQDGPEMQLYQAQAPSTLGVVNPAQVTFPEDDGSRPSLTLLDNSNTLAQGQFLRIPYRFEGTEIMPVRSIELFYKTSEMDDYASIKTTSFAIYDKWYAFIPSDKLIMADYVDYYIKASNAYRTTELPERRITILHEDADLAGLTVHLNGQEALSGMQAFTAKDHSDPGASLLATLDGSELHLSDSLEFGPYFTFSHEGVDSYFKNALLCGDTIIKNFSKCSEIPSDSSMAIQVPVHLFTYREDGSATITLEIWPGTYGSTWENDTDANNDDFYIEDMALTLLDGTVLYPVNTVNQDGTALDASAKLKVGDSADCNRKVIMTFNVPAGKADAMGGMIDTTAISDGEHVLTVTSSTGLSQTVPFMVDNSKPAEPEKEAGPALNMGLTLTASPFTATVDTPQGTDKVELYAARALTDYTVSTGTGDSTISAQAARTLGEVVSRNGQLPYTLFTVETDGATTGSVRVDVTAMADYNVPVQLYALNAVTNRWDRLESAEADGVVSAIVPMSQHVSAGKMTILVQARGAEYNPVTTEPATADTVENSYVWDGTDIPEQYDFAMAWITDTQYYAEQYTENFDAVTDWIVNRKNDLGIAYVIHTGDIVDEFNEEYQFINASRQMKKFEDAGLAYGLLGGNHDVGHGNAIYGLYYQYFGADRYRNFPYYGGTYDNNKGHYDLVSVDGEELLIIYMSWDIYTNEVNWINGVLEQYPDRTAIICTHPGINANAVPDYFSDLLLEQVCKTHPNVIAMLNGHYHGASMNFVGIDDDGDGQDDRVVYRICSDYQSAPEGGQGYIKMLYFDLANDKIYLNAYSPILDDFNYYDAPKLDSYGAGTVAYDQDIAVLPVDFDRDTEKTLTVTDFRANLLTNTLLAEAQGSGIAQLQADTAGAVYAVARDASGKALAYSPVKQLLTITASAGEGGIISPQGITVAAPGSTLTYIFTPDAGCHIARVLVDGVDQGNLESYTFTELTGSHTIEVFFEKNVYTVTLKDGLNNQTIAIQNVRHGENASLPEAVPTHTGYHFTGWDSDGAIVTGDTVITALYEKNVYTVRFLGYDGAEISVQMVPHGEQAEIPDAPQWQGHTFAGWSGDASCVLGDMEITALYTENSYVVFFTDWNGAVLKQQEVAYGEAAQAPEAPSREGYAFVGWSADFSAVTESMIVAARYEINTYTVRFVDFDGTELSVQTVAWGEDAKAPQLPERRGYRFVGWDASYTAVKEDLTVAALYKPDLPFSDVAEDAWFFEDAVWAFSEGIVNGITSTSFGPQGTTTRGQLVTMLYRMSGEQAPAEPHGFTDVPESSYCAEAVRWAAANGTIKGITDTSFAPNQTITREQLVTILYRYVQHYGLDVSVQADLKGYEDFTQVSTYAQIPMSWAVAQGLVEGVTDTSLAPKAAATRCQTVVLLHRLESLVNE